MGPDTRLVVCAPLTLEALSLWTGGGFGGFAVMRTGMGPARSERAARALSVGSARGVVVAGFGGGLDPALRPGDVVVADAVTGPDGRTACDSAALASALLAEGLRVTVGTIASCDHVVTGEERRALFARGAAAVDMESAWLAPAARGRPFSVVRAVVDTAERELGDVLSLLRGGARAARSLARVGRAIRRLAFESSGAPSLDRELTKNQAS